MHRFVLHNDEIREASERSTSPGQVGLLNGWGVFSTLRVVDGVLFAFERHWDRMKRDSSVMHVPFPSDPEWMHSRLLKLVEANDAANATLRVAVVRNHGGPYEGPGQDREFDLIAFTTDLTSWPESVRLALKPDARHAKCEFAGTKILSWSSNLVWNEEAHTRGFDEVVLLNERGEVSECTSANIFAVQGNRIVTPPLSSGCLPGITRALLLEEIRVPGVTATEKPLMLDDLERMEGVFITSSTRDVLPVHEIETLRIRQVDAALIASLREAFAAYREAYVSPKARPLARELLHG